MADKLTIKAGRRRVEVSNPDKVLYPKAGFTKADVAGYYRAIAPVMLRHLKDRPVTLVRFPDGVDGASFFQKACPEHRPDWVATATLHSSARKRDLVYCVLNEQAAIVWAANLASLELHVLLARRRALDRPDFVVFDLDPGPPADVLACCEVALALRARLEAAGLDCYIKTSGSKGLQLYVPVARATYADTRPFAHETAEALERDRGDLVISTPSKAARAGKVFIDWSQNNPTKTTVCAYSLRARARPTVSTPVTWEEIEGALEAGDARRLVFEAGDVLERVERHGDLFAPVLSEGARLR